MDVNIVMDVNITFKDDTAEQEWRDWFSVNSTDMYGLSCCFFAALWAYIMQKKINGGERIEDIAKDAAHEADSSLGNYGMTGFQYGLAVNALATWWKWGEELRVWHNLDTQIGTEGEEANASGGTLNPAILNVGAKEKN